MAHKHAKLMMEYANDAAEHDNPWELWEMQNCMVEWIGVVDNPAWIDEVEYRRKPRTININGIVVPEPELEALEDGDEYFVATPSIKKMFGISVWGSSEYDFMRLERGLVHLTEEAAIQHAKALLSFTTEEK